MQKRTLRSDFCEVTVREPGIVLARVLHEVEIDLEKADIHHSLIEHLTKGEFHCTVIDLNGISGVTVEARKRLQEASSSWGKTIAVALVSESFVTKTIANFFLTVNRPAYPVRVFTDTSEAQTWARNQLFKHTSKAA